MIHALPFPTSMDTDSLPIPEIYIICQSHAAAMQMLDKTKAKRTASLAWLHPETARQQPKNKKTSIRKGFRNARISKNTIRLQYGCTIIHIHITISLVETGWSVTVRAIDDATNCAGDSRPRRSYPASPSHPARLPHCSGVSARLPLRTHPLRPPRPRTTTWYAHVLGAEKATG
jgi:hypothetical protein